MKKEILVILVISIFLLSACTPAVEKVSTSEKSSPAEKKVSSGEVPPVVLPPLDFEIAALLNKNKEATNYNYVYDAEKTQGYAVYRLGNKVKKVYSEPLKMDANIFLNTFYLDLEKKTAFGICDKLGVTCSEQWNKAYPLDFSTQETALSPLDLANAVPITAKIFGGESVDGRSTEIIEYLNAEGKLERLSLDKFYGLPIKQVIYSSADAKSEVEVKHTYTRLAIGQLKESDVSLPEGVEMVKG